MEDFNEYMNEFKEYSLEDKRKTAIDQLKVIASLTNTMCNELNIKNELIVTKDAIEGYKENTTEDDFVEAIVVYASSIQKSLCDFVDKMTDILEKKSRE